MSTALIILSVSTAILLAALVGLLFVLAVVAGGYRR